MAHTGAVLQHHYNEDQRVRGVYPDPIMDPLGWCQHTWKVNDNLTPEWAWDLWYVRPKQYRKLATEMVYAWWLVYAYNKTKQGNYVCPTQPML